MWRAIVPVILLSVVAACGGGSGSDELRIARWAAQVCTVAEDLPDTEDITDGIDPTELSLDERKERADTLIREIILMFDEAAASLQAIDRPSSVREYHDALLTQVLTVSPSLGHLENDIQEADSHEDIEAANAELSIVLERTAEDVNEAGQLLSDDAVSALRAVTSCGNLVP